MAHAGHGIPLADLRERIGRLERGSRRRRAVLPFCVPAIDAHLPAGGLVRGALHEVMEAGAAAEHAAAATLFTAGLLARLEGPVLWCLARRDLFAPALALVGLHPDRVLYAETWREADILPAMEEGLRAKRLGGVVGEVARLGLTASRRLQLAAEASGVMALVIRRWRSDAERALGEEPNAALTRWRVCAARSPAAPGQGFGRARWRVELTRARGAEPRSWLVEACDGAGRLAVPAAVADRPDPQAVRWLAAAE